MLEAKNFPKYPKIQSLYKRDNKGNFTGEFSSEYFEYLYGIMWIGTEKVHGTNVRIVYDNEQKEASIFGRGNNSELPYFLREVLSKYLNVEAFSEQFSTASKVVLFGEGFGKGIQDVGNRYISSTSDFILFDVWIDGWWLRREDVETIATNLGMRVVPVVFQGSLRHAETNVSTGYLSIVAEDKTLSSEGLVLMPIVPLFDRRGHRIMTKIKTEDFR